MQLFNKIKKFLAAIGPGFIVASAVLGPGSITIASKIGSEHGCTFLWVIVIATISMIVYASMSLRAGVVNDNSILEIIATNYGRWFSSLIGISAFMAASSFQFGNNLGVGLAMERITGINERVWPFIFTPSAILLVFWAKNLYRILEKLMIALVALMVISFFLNMILAKPDAGQIAMGLVPHSFGFENMDIIAALVGTTFVLHGALYQSYLVQDKGLKVSGMKQGLRESGFGISILGFITIMLVITSSAVLHPYGITVNSAADMAVQLELLFGRYAGVIFSIGLFAAAFSSLMVNAVMGGGLLSDGLGLGRSMNQKMPKIFTSVILLLGMLVAVLFRGNAIYALILASASSIFAVPLIAAGIFLVLNSKKVMGRYRNNIWQNILAVFGFILISLMVYYMYYRLVTYLNSL
ncbi:MAG: Nramp family divalent metal transporter [Prolixibacteraceae bacterium]|nr:Nramp family divalent metal transporter [Prolixibacteraceae bacterium]